MNHVPRDVGGRHYDSYAREKKKQAALDLWWDALDKTLKRAAR